MNNMPSYPWMAQAPGKNFLLVTGILLIVFNGLGILGTAITLLGINEWLRMFGDESMRGTLILTHTAHIPIPLFSIAVGIMGIALRNKVEKGKMLFNISIVAIIIGVIYNVIFAAVTNILSESGFSVRFGIPILLILYAVGAHKNKKAHEAAQHGHQNDNIEDIAKQLKK